MAHPITANDIESLLCEEDTRSMRCSPGRMFTVGLAE